jgi:hypothetical protein
MFKTNSSQRLALWRQFRSTIGNLSLDIAISQTNNFWANCPFTPFYLDPNEPKNWPNPWELIEENYYCDLAKSLGIIYTLHLSSHSSVIEPELRIYLNKINRHQYHIAYLCRGKYVLNLINDQVVNKEHINQDLNLIRCYTAEDLQLEKY